MEEVPLERRAILAFLLEASRQLAPGSRVLDAGAGEAPYGELFSHCRYTTLDRAQSVHPGGREADIVASLMEVPAGEGSFDAVLLTQVLEHVADPLAVLSELCRVLGPGGRLWLTAPLVAELHEEPDDFFRYTAHGLLALCAAAGFVQVRVQPLTGYFSTLAQMARNGGLAIGARSWRSDPGRRLLAAALRALARPLPVLDRLDRQRGLPLGYRCSAVRPR